MRLLPLFAQHVSGVDIVAVGDGLHWCNSPSHRCRIHFGWETIPFTMAPTHRMFAGHAFVCHISSSDDSSTVTTANVANATDIPLASSSNDPRSMHLRKVQQKKLKGLVLTFLKMLHVMKQLNIINQLEKRTSMRNCQMILIRMTRLPSQQVSTAVILASWYTDFYNLMDIALYHGPPTWQFWTASFMSFVFHAGKFVASTHCESLL